RLSPEGKASVFYATKQEHVLCVAVGPDGQVYAGSDKNGLVYRIDGKGKAFVLYQAPQTEVRSLLSSGHSSSKAEKESDSGRPAPAPPRPSTGENSLYRIAADGTVREVFREKALVLSQLRLNGRLFVGTGMDGQLFEVDEVTRERSEIARLDHGQVLCMAHRADGSMVLGTGDPGRLYVLEDRYVARGTVTSEVFDAKIVSKWGSLRWQAGTPAGTKVTVAVRSGNVAEPDETWSDWSDEQADGDKATITAPPARFLQYRVTLSTEKPESTPALRGIALRYATTNQAPEVMKVEVPNLDAVDLDNPKKLKFKWSGEDANEDVVTYNLYVRKDGWKNWVLLDEDLEKSDYEWDTTTTPSGVYRLKVVASDHRDNAPGEALTGERVSDAFVVSHTPPSVQVKVAGIDEGIVVLEATGTSELVRLTAASFSLNGKKWMNVFPTDGLFDSRTETFKFKTETLKPGTYVVVLRVRDAAGNTGSGDVVFTVPARSASK
ncbi:MAG: hypothetical protein HYS12_13130, partial [Planctomycetes bacterium]|nr:hypothetical protein [Planctomycetota bacterium]